MAPELGGLGDLRADYLAAMRLVPGPIAIVAAAVAAGDRTGMAATAWNSLSADPPTLLACVNRSTSVYAMVEQAQAFSVNLLASDHPETVAIFSAKRGLSGAARFLPGLWEDGALGQPRLKSAIASFACRLQQTHEHGSHVVFIGEVAQIARRRDADAALLYLDGAFALARAL